MYTRALVPITTANYLRHTAILLWALQAPYLTTTRPFSSKQLCPYKRCLDMWSCFFMKRVKYEISILIAKQMWDFSLSVLMMLILVSFCKTQQITSSVLPHYLKRKLERLSKCIWSYYNQSRILLLFVRPVTNSGCTYHTWHRCCTMLRVIQFNVIMEDATVLGNVPYWGWLEILSFWNIRA